MPNLSILEIEQIRTLEESMWDPKIRFNKEYMEDALAIDFFEFGCSGRVYNRAEIIDIEPREFHATLPLKKFKIHSIAENVIQTTYISEVEYDNLQICNRSSIWVKNDDGWKLRFHQGTPVTN